MSNMVDRITRRVSAAHDVKRNAVFQYTAVSKTALIDTYLKCVKSCENILANEETLGMFYMMERVALLSKVIGEMSTDVILSEISNCVNLFNRLQEKMTNLTELIMFWDNLAKNNKFVTLRRDIACCMQIYQGMPKNSRHVSTWYNITETALLLYHSYGLNPFSLELMHHAEIHESFWA